MSGRLPKRASLAHLKRQARELLKEYRDGRTQARVRAGIHLPRLSGDSAGNAGPDITLQEARHVIAKEHGFAGWARVVDAIEPGAALSAPAAGARGRCRAGPLTTAYPTCFIGGGFPHGPHRPQTTWPTTASAGHRPRRAPAPFIRRTR